MTTMERVKKILSDVSGANDIADEATLAEDLDLDSLDRLDVVIHLEEEFGIEIPDDDVDDPALGTTAGLAAYVDRRLGNAQVGA